MINGTLSNASVKRDPAEQGDKARRSFLSRPIVQLNEVTLSVTPMKAPLVKLNGQQNTPMISGFSFNVNPFGSVHSGFVY